MEKVNSLVCWYQHKIGTYDKQLWERSVERTVIKNIEHVPRKLTKVKTDLIDVDLVRGSTFPKAKPKHGWWFVSWRGLLRVVFLPLYIKWWRQQSSLWFSTLLLFLYISQVGTLVLYFSDTGTQVSAETLSLAHLVSPVILIVILGFIHSQIVATQILHKHRRPPSPDRPTGSEKKKHKSSKSGRSSKPPVVVDDYASGHADTEETESLRKRKRKVLRKKQAEEYSGVKTERTSPRLCEIDRSTSVDSSNVCTEEDENLIKVSPKQPDRSAPRKPSRMTLETLTRDKMGTLNGEEGKLCGKCSLNSDSPETQAKTGDILNSGGGRPLTSRKLRINGEPTEIQTSSNIDVSAKSQQMPYKQENNSLPETPIIDDTDLAAKITHKLSHKQNLCYHTEDHINRDTVCDNKTDIAAKTTLQYNGLNEFSCLQQGFGRDSKKKRQPEMTSDCTEITCHQVTGNDVTAISNRSGWEKEEEYYKNAVLADDSIMDSPCDEDISLPLTSFQGEIVAPGENGFQLTNNVHVPCDKPHSTLCHTGVGKCALSDRKIISRMSSSEKSALLGTSEEATSDFENITVSSEFNEGITNLSTSSNNKSSSHEMPSNPISNNLTHIGINQNSPSRETILHLNKQRNLNKIIAVEKDPSLVNHNLETSLCMSTPGCYSDDQGAQYYGQDASEERMQGREIQDIGRGTGTIEIINTNMETESKDDTRRSRFPSVPSSTRRGCEESSGNSSCDSDGEITPNVPTPKGQTSEMEWDANSGDMTTDTSSQVTTETELSGREDEGRDSEGYGWSENLHYANSVMNNLASSTDKVSCIIWETEEVKKVDLTVLDLGWTIIHKAEKIPEKSDYVLLGLVFSLVITCLPALYRFHQLRDRLESLHGMGGNVTKCLHVLKIFIGDNWLEQVVIVNGLLQRLCIALMFFFLLSVAERTFKQRLLYAKHFCYLTSCRRAKKYDMPHFRLNKVRNIKTWLSLRSYLKRRGPQRSVNTIVSSAFILEVTFLSLMCVELLHDSGGFLDHLGNWELVLWCLALGVYLLRFMTLGTQINKKYRNFSVLITEQINLYLHMEQKPHKKEELTLANNVLKLAEALLKELENPFKISGLSVNPFLYNTFKVVILSAFSAVLTELLGFKLKLYKIKLKA